MKRKIIGCFILAALYAGHASGADLNASSTANTPSAENIQPIPSAGWEFAITPYFWAASLSGKTAQFNSPTIDIDPSFNKLFDNLDFGAMIMGEARKGRYSIFGDLMYVQIGMNQATPRGILAKSADLTTSSFAGFVGASYSVLESPDYRLDVAAGARLWSVDTDITLNGGILRGRRSSDSATWVDGLVGLRGNYAFNSKVYVTSWGLAGAGGADFDWDLGIGVGYNFNKSIAATVGYRAMGVNYSQGGFVYDVVQKGPMAGVTIRF